MRISLRVIGKLNTGARKRTCEFLHLGGQLLDTIAEHFSIPIASRHRAGSDALATAEIFLFLLTELEETHGIKDLAAARNFQFPELLVS